MKRKTEIEKSFIETAVTVVNNFNIELANRSTKLIVELNRDDDDGIYISEIDIYSDDEDYSFFETYIIFIGERLELTKRQLKVDLKKSISKWLAELRKN